MTRFYLLETPGKRTPPSRNSCACATRHPVYNAYARTYACLLSGNVSPDDDDDGRGNWNSCGMDHWLSDDVSAIARQKSRGERCASRNHEGYAQRVPLLIMLMLMLLPRNTIAERVERVSSPFTDIYGVCTLHRNDELRLTSKLF